MSGGLFKQEEALLNDAKEKESSNSFDAEQNKLLLKGYEKLLKQTRRLVKMSDRTEAELNRMSKEQVELNQTLSEQNTKLETLSVKLSKYLSPQVYESIFSGKAEVRVGADRKYLTVFFSDIVSFTEITDQLEPEILTRSLNAYLNEMAIVAISQGATIDKYIGDSIMAFFGDPETLGPQHDAVKCVTMALSMQEKVKLLNHELNKIGVTRPFNIRCGINSGICTVGNFGSENRLDYTAIGNQVNLASRLESASGVGEVLISEETMLLTQEHFDFEPNQEIHVKGFARPIKTYTVNGHKTRKDLSGNLSFHSKGLDLEIDPLVLNEDSKKAITELIPQLQNIIQQSTKN